MFVSLVQYDDYKIRTFITSRLRDILLLFTFGNFTNENEKFN